VVDRENNRIQKFGDVVVSVEPAPWSRIEGLYH